MNELPVNSVSLISLFCKLMHVYITVCAKFSLGVQVLSWGSKNFCRPLYMATIDLTNVVHNNCLRTNQNDERVIHPGESAEVQYKVWTAGNYILIAT